jgi:hypothetical protein
VLTAIDLDYQLFLQADKVDNLRSDRTLSTEFMAVYLPVAKVPPEKLFRIRQITP